MHPTLVQMMAEVRVQELLVAAHAPREARREKAFAAPEHRTVADRD